MAEFRSYDPVIGRYLQGDPIIKYKESSYASFVGNPINFIDPLGADTLKQIGKDLFYGGYLDGPTVTAKASSQNSSKSNSRSLIDEIFVNRFRHWEPMGTGAGLSVNPNFPQYSQYAEDIKQISWNMLSPVLMGVAGGGMASGNSGARFFIHRLRNQWDLFRLTRLMRPVNQPTTIVNYVDEVSRSALLPLRQAPRGGIRIGNRFYNGGEFLPGSRTVSYSRQFINPEYLNIPPLSNTLRPSPIFYPELSPIVRWTIGGGGAGLGLYWGLNQNRPK